MARICCCAKLRVRLPIIFVRRHSLDLDKNSLPDNPRRTTAQMSLVLASTLRRTALFAAVSKPRFCSTTIETVPLVFTRHDSPTSTTSGNPPLVILHGLFGSKQNNHSISK